MLCTGPGFAERYVAHTARSPVATPVAGRALTEHPVHQLQISRGVCHAGCEVTLRYLGNRPQRRSAPVADTQPLTAWRRLILSRAAAGDRLRREGSEMVGQAV
jgi:hypothetical protein